MPAEQGVVNWPASGRSASALVAPDMLPLPDGSIDRVLVVHALETAEHPSVVLEEVWRVLTPGGRMIVVTPSRRGVWARVDGTPFGQGQPYSKGQLRDLMREALFSPIYWGEALYAPPFRRRFFINSAPAIERVGAAIGLPFAGRANRRSDQAGLSPGRRAPPCAPRGRRSPARASRPPRIARRRAVFEIVAGGGSCF